MSPRTGNPYAWNGSAKSTEPRTKQERQDYNRAPLRIRTPEVADPELRKRWHGMPPSRVEFKKRPVGTLDF